MAPALLFSEKLILRAAGPFSEACRPEELQRLHAYSSSLRMQHVG